jgi:hypothetical protein
MKCDGVTDDTVNFQTAINAAVRGTLLLPSGMCIISSTIAITATIHIIGAGGGANELYAGTTLQWTGASNVPMIDLQGIQDSVFEEFLIQATAAHPLAIGIRSITTAGKLSNANKFQHMYMNGTTMGLGKGFAFVAGSGGDNNNDENTFEDVTVSNFTKAAWSFEHSQSMAHRLNNCRYYGASGQTNQYGVTTALGPSGFGGNFIWHGGFGCCVGESDFYLGMPSTSAILISGGNFESSARLLKTWSNGGNGFVVTIEGTRWAGNMLAADGKAIIYTLQGPLNLIGNTIGEYPANPLQIYIQDWATPMVANAIGNNIMTSLTAPFTGNGTWALSGNLLNRGPAVKLPNRYP